MTIDLTAARIAWTTITTGQIEAIAAEARLYGDEGLYRRARRALARRR